MKKMKSYNILGLLAIELAAIALPQSAIAQTVFLNGADRVLVFEGTPNAPFESFIWTGKTKIFTANACGLVIVPTLEHSFQRVFAGTRIDYSSLPIQNLVTCSAGILSEPRSVNFKTPDGRTVLVGQPGATEVQYMSRSRRAGTMPAALNWLLLKTLRRLVLTQSLLISAGKRKA
jgi:hypothetical protein